MAKRRATFAERYWFAIGYHHGITKVQDPPSKEMVDFVLSTISVQIGDLYEEGQKAGDKDRERGYE